MGGLCSLMKRHSHIPCGASWAKPRAAVSSQLLGTLLGHLSGALSCAGISSFLQLLCLRAHFTDTRMPIQCS